MNRRIAIMGSIGVCGLGLSAQSERPPIVKHVGEKEVNVLMLDPLNFAQTAELLETAMTHGVKVKLYTLEDAKSYGDFVPDAEVRSIAHSVMKLHREQIYDIPMLDYHAASFREQKNQMSKREQRNRQRKHNY